MERPALWGQHWRGGSHKIIDRDYTYKGMTHLKGKYEKQKDEIETRDKLLFELRTVQVGKNPHRRGSGGWKKSHRSTEYKSEVRTSRELSQSLESHQ